MARFRRTYRVARSAEQVFDVIGTHLYENHPRWEREVVEIRPLTPGPVRLGSRAVMVREEYGRRSEGTYEITAFEPGRLVSARHLDGPMDFDLSFGLAPVDERSCDLTVSVDMALRGRLRPLSPLLGIQLPGRSDRISRSCIALVEAGPPAAVASWAAGPEASRAT
jgi:hypothetical protein